MLYRAGGMFFFLLIAASALPSRQVFAVSLRPLRIGVSGTTIVDGVSAGADAAIVTAALLWAVDPAWLLAVTVQE